MTALRGRRLRGRGELPHPAGPDEPAKLLDVEERLGATDPYRRLGRPQAETTRVKRAKALTSRSG